MKYYGLYGARTRDLLRDKQARTPTSPTTQDNDSQLLNTITNNKTIIKEKEQKGIEPLVQINVHLFSKQARPTNSQVTPLFQKLNI